MEVKPRIGQTIGWGDQGEPHEIVAVGGRKVDIPYVKSKVTNSLIPLTAELWQPLPEPQTIEQSYFLDFA